MRCCDLTRIADLHINVAQVCAADHPFHRAGIRHDDDIVLIDALRAQPFWREHARDRERHIFDPQNLPDWIFIAVNLCRGGAANHANLVRAADVLRCKRCAVRQRPLANVKIICRLAEYPGEPVLISGCDLCRRNDFLTDADDTGHFAPNCFRVFDLQRAGAAPAGANAARGSAPRKDQDYIFSEAGDLRFHLRLGAVADADHGNDSANTDDNTERGKHRTHFVSAQRAVGDIKCRGDSHLIR